MSDDTREPGPTARIEVVGGGEVRAEQLAALVVALTPVAVAPSVDVGRSGPVGPPAWAQAALLEGVGLLPPIQPSDLQRVRLLG